jgi:hypothetical protein
MLLKTNNVFILLSQTISWNSNKCDAMAQGLIGSIVVWSTKNNSFAEAHWE